jgi:diguanylate cyclase (GGDEF)-like protein
MDRATLFRLAAPGRLPEQAVFILSMLVMLAIFIANVVLADPSLRLYVLYALPLLAIGMHTPRRSLYVVGVLTALSLEALTFVSMHQPIATMIGNLLLEAVVAVVCLSVADTARDSYLQMLNLARTDDLTGLMNRRAFVRAAEQEIERQARYGGEFSLLLLDLDGFKGLNDRHGHHIGDQALRRLATALRNNTRRSDAVARLGGDEFVVLMPNTPKMACAGICHQLRKAVAGDGKEAGLSMTASIGSVTFEQPPESVDAALQAADEAMYRAKGNGGDCVVSA